LIDESEDVMERIVERGEWRPNQALQRTAAPRGWWGGWENLSATVAADRAFPAAVAELGR